MGLFITRRSYKNKLWPALKCRNHNNSCDAFLDVGMGQLHGMSHFII